MDSERANVCTALGLLSGGLDSTLAAAVLAGLGVKVIGVNFSTGFCLTDHRRLLHGGHAEGNGRRLQNEALRAGADLRIPVEIIDISEEYMEVLTRPRYGYGSAVNPCVDCRIMMLSKARELMPAHGASFVFTGEVLGQRPMTQMRNTLRLIEKQSGLRGRLLRPLSALKLEETVPEAEGLVPRNRLYGFSGRGRKAQEALARELGIEDYPQPAGGCCFLTDKNFARRMKTVLAMKGTLDRDDIFLLKLGRQIRVGDVRLIVGRNEAENHLLRRYGPGRWTFEVKQFPSPLIIGEGTFDADLVETAAGIAARYSDGKNHARVRVHYTDAEGREGSLDVPPARPEEVDRYRI